MMRLMYSIGGVFYHALCPQVRINIAKGGTKKGGMMLEEIQRSFLAGLGAVLLTKNKINEVTRQLVDEARISREDAERLADDLYQAGQHQWISVENSIKDSIRKALSSLDIGSRRELDKLSTDLDNLQKRVKILEDTQDNTTKQRSQ